MAATTSSEKQAITDLNAQQSPLLRLPSEIRNRIYELVLGGNRVHISPRKAPRGRRYRPTICSVDLNNEDITEDFRGTGHPTADAEGQGPQKLAFDELHRHCTNRQLDGSICNPLDYLSLSLLRVCRQTHQEAALLPFSLNNFVVTRLVDLLDFLMVSLTGPQRDTIATMSLHFGYFVDHYSDLPESLSSLKGLRSLTLDFETSEIPKSPQDSMIPGYFSRSNPSIFSQQYLTDLKVGIFRVRGSDYNRLFPVRVQEYPDLAREYAEALLKASKGQAEVKEV